MSLANYFSPVVSWTIGISIFAVTIPPMVDGFVIGGGSTLLEQARVEFANIFNWGSNSTFTPPLRGNLVKTSLYGMRRHPVTGLYAFHNGVDFDCQHGQEVYAVDDGVVNYAGFAGNAGKTVMLDHEGGLQSLYMHLSEVKAVQGKQVKQGQLIGLCGNTGRSTGTHLHLSFKRNGRFINPQGIGF